MINIVCYTGGTCGDLVSALIDPTGAEFKGTTVKHVDDRTRLKKPHLFADDNDKDKYLSQASDGIYKSISSHDLAYHQRQQHHFIGISVQDFAIALRCAERFKVLHRPHVWQEMSQVCGVNTVEEYAQMLIDFSNLVRTATDRIVTLESIWSGDAITEIEKYLESPVTKTASVFYSNWLKLQK